MLQQIQVELNHGYLIIGGNLRISGNQVDVSGYGRVMIGQYDKYHIEDRRMNKIWDQLRQEDLLVPDTSDLSGRTMKLSDEGRVRQGQLHSEIPLDNYTKYMMLIRYGRGVDFEQLQQQVSNAIPSELKDSIEAKVHITEPGGRLIASPPPDGIELMVADDVQLVVKH